MYNLSTPTKRQPLAKQVIMGDWAPKKEKNSTVPLKKTVFSVVSYRSSELGVGGNMIFDFLKKRKIFNYYF